MSFMVQNSTMMDLADHSPVEIEHAERWLCNKCDGWNDGPLPDGGEEIYDLSDLISDVTNWAEWGRQIKVGELERATRDYTASFSPVVCTVNQCVVDRDEVNSESGYKCPGCEELKETAHEARDCCLVHDLDDSDEDTCLQTTLINDTTRAQGYSYCYCRTECMVKICLTCCVELRRTDDMQAHVKGHQVEVVPETYDEQVMDVGRPASLEPGYVYVEENDSPAPTRPALTRTCELCDSEFCCTIHANHKSPHRGHEG